MLNKSVESTLARLLFIGTPFVTLFLVTDSVTDPVNVTKLLAAGAVGFAAFAVTMTYGFKTLWRESKSLVITVGLFLVAALNAVINSAAPLAQNFYGTYGRNTGFIMYLSLAFITMAAALLRQKKYFDRLIQGLFFAGIVNVAYCAWVLAFGDFIRWSNPYGNILGLFGNPNFIAAFLGMFIAAIVAFIFQKGLHWGYRAAGVLLSLVAFYEIYRSVAVQGLVVTAAGLVFVGFYLVRSWFTGWVIPTAYTVAVSAMGGMALLGALQKGPLTEYIYKTSVSLRGSYWHAGLSMGSSHPFTGVGMDAYGDWYRRARSLIAATTTPGPSTISNAPHNVVIDFFAYGGYPLLLTYLALLGLGVWAIVRVTARRRSYDATFVAIAVTWTCYQLQSIISINQVGLAIWGWLFTGALLAYEITTRPEKAAVGGSEPKPAGRSAVKAKTSDPIFSASLVAGLGLLLGLLVAAPPYSADSRWRSALVSQNVVNIEAALAPAYLSPRSSFRLASAVQLLEQSKMSDLAYKYAKIGVAYNPDFFDGWRMMYAISKSTPADKATALANMKRLDPLNADVTK